MVQFCPKNLKFDFVLFSKDLILSDLFFRVCPVWYSRPRSRRRAVNKPNNSLVFGSLFELQFPKKDGIKCAPVFFLSSHKSCTLILRKLLICAKKFRNNFLDVAYQTDDQLWLGLRTPNETFFSNFPKYFAHCAEYKVFLVVITSDPQKSLPSVVLYYYCSW